MKKTVTDILSKVTDKNKAPNRCQSFLHAVSLLVQSILAIFVLPTWAKKIYTSWSINRLCLQSHIAYTFLSIEIWRVAILLSYWGRRDLIPKTAASVHLSCVFPVTFIHLLVPATTVTKIKFKQLKRSFPTQLILWFCGSVKHVRKIKCFLWILN